MRGIFGREKALKDHMHCQKISLSENMTKVCITFKNEGIIQLSQRIIRVQ